MGLKGHAPGARRGAVGLRRVEAEPALSLEAELEGVLTDAVGGDPPGPMLARRLERLAREVLLRRGLREARVVAQSDGEATVVHVVLPPGPQRVRTLALSIRSAL